METAIPEKSILEKQILTMLEGNAPKTEDIKTAMDNFRVSMLYYRCAIKEIETKIAVLNEEFSLRYDRNPISSVHSRLKEAPSIIEKLQRKGHPVTLQSMEENIFDIAGVRVVCPFLGDVYFLEKALLEQDDISLIERKDYIAKPKANGYRSLHLIISVPIFLSQGKRSIKVELQIRTISMDSWATLEHQIRYKKNVTASEYREKELKVCSELTAEFDRRMEELRYYYMVTDGYKTANQH